MWGFVGPCSWIGSWTSHMYKKNEAIDVLQDLVHKLDPPAVESEILFKSK